MFRMNKSVGIQVAFGLASQIVFIKLWYLWHANILQGQNTPFTSIINLYYTNARFHYNYSDEGLGSLWRNDTFPVRLTFFASAFYSDCWVFSSVRQCFCNRTSAKKNILLHEKKSDAKWNKYSCYITFENTEHEIKKHATSDFFSRYVSFFSCDGLLTLDLQMIMWRQRDLCILKDSKGSAFQLKQPINTGFLKHE